MHPRPSIDQIDPTSLSSFQRERQASMLRLSRELDVLESGAPPASSRQLQLRSRLLVSTAAVLLLALAIVGIVAAVQ